MQWRRRWVCVWVGMVMAAGCGGAPPQCSPGSAGPLYVVLTFDDGPMASDIADNVQATPGELLGPLDLILEVLERRGVEAVFFVAGPGTDAAADTLAGTFADGLASIQRGGHVLGYHAFSHDPGIWVDPILPPGLAESIMSNDLDRLERFIEDALMRRNQTLFLQPIYRQPFGGSGYLAFEGLAVAQARGWVYHGYRVDSADWLANADVDPGLLRRLGADTEAGLVQYVGSRLSAGAVQNADCGQMDVLFHVNAFTASHLDLWIDTVMTALAGSVSRSVIVDVPDEYLRVSDSFVDTTVGADVFVGAGE